MVGESRSEFPNELSGRFLVDPSTVSFLGGGQEWSDGVLYSYRHLPESCVEAGSQKMVIKYMRFPACEKKELQRLEERIGWARYFGENGCSIITPERSSRGNLYEKVEAEGEVYLAYTYKMAAGRSARGGDACVRSGAYFRAMGATMGQLHALSQQRVEQLQPDGTSSLSGSLGGWREEWSFFREWCADDEVRTAWEHLRGEIARLTVSKATYGFVHNDAHTENLIFDPEVEPALSGGEPLLTAIDLDVSDYQFFAGDAAIALYSIETIGRRGLETPNEAPEGFTQWANREFWRGYGRFRDPALIDPHLVELFLQYRRCLLFMPFQKLTAGDAQWHDTWKARIQAADAALFS